MVDVSLCFTGCVTFMSKWQGRQGETLKVPLKSFKNSISSVHSEDFTVPNADLEVLDKIIYKRYACRKWKKGIRVPKEQIEGIVERAQRAPSSLNIQPYKIIIVEEDEDKERLAQAMGEQNPDHVRSSSFSAVFVADPDAIPLLGENPPKWKVEALQVSLAQQSSQTWAVKSAMPVVDHFLLVAAAYDLDTNPMEGFQSQEAVRQALDIPDRYVVTIVVAVGYGGSDAKPPMSDRHPMKEMCFFGRFGQDGNWEAPCW